MAQVSKIESNATGLRVAEEDSLGVLPNTPVWYPLEPNSYDKFGAEIKTVARNPINAGRQRKKGVVVDLDAGGGFEVDLTETGAAIVMPGFFFADFRDKDDTDDAIVNGTSNAYEPASGGLEFQVDDLVFAKGFSTAANNGLKQVSGTVGASSVPVTDTGLVDETGASGTISRVGFEYDSDILSVNATSGLPQLEAANVAASSTLTITGTDNAGNGETVTIGSKVYTFETVLTNVDGNVFIGANKAASLANLSAAINLGAGSGTTYAAATTLNADVSGNGASPLVVTAKVKGKAGNHIATSQTMAHGTWTGAFLASGAGRAFTTLGLIPGEFIFVGSDETNTSFAQAANNGFARVRSVASDVLVLDKSAGEMVDDAGTGKTVRLYFGRVLKNESDPTLQVRRSYQLERSLGAPDDASPSQIQAEYLVGAIPNKYEIKLETAKKVTVKVDFMGKDSEFQASTDGLKGGTRPTVSESDGLNSTSDVSRIKLSLVDLDDSNVTPLFAFVTDMTLSINNNIKPNKAIGVLGAFDNSAGNFEVKADCTAYFVDVESAAAVRDNSDVTLDLHLVKNNAGVSFDLPLVSLGDGRPDVKANEPITLPLNVDAATGSKLYSDLDHTLLMVFWDYLPDAAE